MKTATWTLIFLLAAVGAGWGKMRLAEEVPVERVLKNAEAYLKANPDDAQGWYLTGRIHYAAFMNRAPDVSVHRNSDGKPAFAPDRQRDPVDWGQRMEAMRRTLKKYGYATEEEVPKKGKVNEEFFAAMRKEWMRLQKEKWKPAEVAPEVTAKHAVDGLAALDRSLVLDGKNALTHLTRGSLLRKIREWLPGAGLKEVPAELKAITAADVRGAFLKSWENSVEEELKAKTKPAFTFFTAAEAGDEWVKLCVVEAADLTDAEREMLPKVRESLKKLAAKPPSGMISPVIFSLEKGGPSSIHGLLAPETRVWFDLGGRGVVQRWPWVKPETCLLVWDPDKSGVITSGRQLFGNATFQLVFRDGFEAMRLLDDNGDGVLTGEELRGLAVWRDADSNGVSARGEVMAVEAAGIAEISVRAEGKEDGVHPWNAEGVRMRDGSTRGVWDWFAEAVEGARTGREGARTGGEAGAGFRP